MSDERPRRKQKRVQLCGSVRLLLDTPDGLVMTDGQIIDLSEGGCAIHLHRPIGPNLAGRVHVKLAGRTLGLPVLTRWAGLDRRVPVRPPHRREATRDTRPDLRAPQCDDVTAASRFRGGDDQADSAARRRVA
jgi:PilZ domain